MELFRSRLLIRYLITEMIPSFLIGVISFVSILLMFQALRLTEFVLIHGVEIETIGRIMMYLSISFLPVIFPMSLIFTVLLTYSRLSADSEIVAMRSSGISMASILSPAVLFSLAVAILSAQTSFQLAPWGNRKFEVLINKLANAKASVAIKEGTFSEGFFDLVIYANEVDNEKGLLKDVFIYDERDPNVPLTIIAQSGLMSQKESDEYQSAQIKLLKGNLHRIAKGRHTKLNFDEYDILLSTPIKQNVRSKSMPSLTFDELNQLMRDKKIEEKKRRRVVAEYHKRWALAFACILFALVGVGLGIRKNRRSARSNGIVLSLVVIVGYWVIYVSSESLVRGGASFPPGLAMWIANFLFIIASFFSLKRVWN